MNISKLLALGLSLTVMLSLGSHATEVNFSNKQNSVDSELSDRLNKKLEDHCKQLEYENSPLAEDVCTKINIKNKKIIKRLNSKRLKFSDLSNRLYHHSENISRSKHLKNNTVITTKLTGEEFYFLNCKMKNAIQAGMPLSDPLSGYNGITTIFDCSEEVSVLVFEADYSLPTNQRVTFVFDDDASNTNPFSIKSYTEEFSDGKTMYFLFVDRQQEIKIEVSAPNSINLNDNKIIKVIENMQKKYIPHTSKKQAISN